MAPLLARTRASKACDVSSRQPSVPLSDNVFVSCSMFNNMFQWWKCKSFYFFPFRRFVYNIKDGNYFDLKHINYANTQKRFLNLPFWCKLGSTFLRKVYCWISLLNGRANPSSTHEAAWSKQSSKVAMLASCCMFRRRYWRHTRSPSGRHFRWLVSRAAICYLLPSAECVSWVYIWSPGLWILSAVFALVSLRPESIQPMRSLRRLGRTNQSSRGDALGCAGRCKKSPLPVSSCLVFREQEEDCGGRCHVL